MAENFDINEIKSDIEVYRWSNIPNGNSGLTQILLDKNRYKLDGKWHKRGDTGNSYTELSAAEIANYDQLYVKIVSTDNSAQDDETNCLYAEVNVINDMNINGFRAKGLPDSVWFVNDLKVPSASGLRNGETTLKEDTDYTQDKDHWWEATKWDENGEPTEYKELSSAPKTAGTYYVKFTSAGNYNGELYEPIKVIEGLSLKDYNLYVNNPLYAGHVPELSDITLGCDTPTEVELVKGTDYELLGWYSDKELKNKISKPSAEGQYYLAAKGLGSYASSGTVAVRATVQKTNNLGAFDVEGIQLWDDKNIPSTFNYKVTADFDSALTLKQGADFEDSGKWFNEDGKECDQIAPGEYYRVLNGKNNYTDSSVYAWVRVLNHLDLENYYVKVDESKCTNGAGLDSINPEVVRTVSGTEEALASDSYTLTMEKWNSKEGKFESVDKISGPGTYQFAATAKNGSDYINSCSEEIVVGDPCENGHVNLVKHDKVESTCTVKGKGEYWECTECDKWFSDAEGKHEIQEIPTLPLAAHKYDAGTVTTAPTCTASGVKTSHCTVCAATKTESIAAKGHSFKFGSINWTSGGVSAATATFTCDNGCGKSETVTASISKKLTTKPTCTVKGINTYTAAATSSTGATASSSKTVQDEPALGHAYGPYTVTVQPTADKTGTATAKCTHEGCTSTVTRTLEKLKSEQTVSGAAGTGTTATATVTEIKPTTTPSGVNVAGSVSLDSVTAPASATKIEVPETVTINNVEYAVTKVDPKVFADKTALTEVSLPDTVEELPSGLFKGCSSLAAVKLPSKITEIPADTFNGTAITNAVLPAMVTKIGNRAFEGTQLTSVSLPSSLSSLGKDAFKDCKKLTGVTLPANFKSIPAGAFSGCSALKGIAPAAGIKALDLAGTAAPTTVDISKVTTIGANAFKGCKSITTVNASKATTIGGGAFSGTAKLKSLKTGTGLKTIGKSALSGNKKLKTLELKTKKLTKSGVKSSLKGSAVKTVSVKVAGSKKTKAKYVAAYKKIFTAKNCGKKVSVK